MNLLRPGEGEDVTNKVHRWKRQLLYADKAAYVIVVGLLGVVRPDALMIGVYVLLYPYLYLTGRKKAVYHLIVASGIAFLWMLIAHRHYGYNRELLVIFGLNTYPFFAWASGLFAAYLLYSHWEHRFRPATRWKKLLLFAAFYWPILIAVETVAYHVFFIRNVATGAYAGLPLCDCIHAPIWMQVAYLVLGPLYFGLCELFGLENPHDQQSRVEGGVALHPTSQG